MNSKCNFHGGSRFCFTVSEKKFVYAILFILLPVMDMFNGYGVANGYLTEGGLASPSQVARAFMLSVFLYVIAKRKINISILAIFAPIFLTELVTGILLQDAFGFSYGVISVYKLIYIVIIGVTLSWLVKDYRDIKTFSIFLKFNIFIIASSIYFSLLTGLGSSTYGWGFGTKSFFASGNGLGIYLGVSCLILMVLTRYKLSNGFGLIANLYVLFSIACIGSKTSFLLCFVILLFLVFFSKQKLLLIFIVLFALLLTGNFILEFIPAIFDVIISRAEHSDGVGQYIASGRGDYVKDAISVFTTQDSSIFRLPFGSGAFLSYQYPFSHVQYDTLETDVFDLLFMYGIYGLFLYFLIAMYIAYLLKSHFAMLFVFVLLMLHSAFAGHVLFNGMSSITLSMFFFIARYLSHQENPSATLKGQHFV